MIASFSDRKLPPVFVLALHFLTAVLILVLGWIWIDTRREIVEIRRMAEETRLEQGRRTSRISVLEDNYRWIRVELKEIRTLLERSLRSE